MSFDKNDLDSVKKLSKDEFHTKLSNAVQKAGIEPTISNMLLKDTEKIRKAISSLSEKDLAQISQTLQKNNMGQIENIIKNEIRGNKNG